MTNNMTNKAQPAVIILSAPSGAGKTSLARKLVAERDDVALTVSHTTRPMRPGETDGVDYFFVSEDEFEAMIADDKFIEYATVFGNHYGTSTQTIEQLISRGKHAILEIDWQGARTVRQKFPNAKSVFIMPPSLDALQQRLQSRKQDADAVIGARMRAAQNEMSHRDEYDYVIVNDDFQQAFARLQAAVATMTGDV